MPIVQKHKNVTKHFFPSEEAYTKAMEQGLVQEGDEVYVEGEEINEELLEILNNKADLVDGKVPEEQLPEIASSWNDLKDKPTIPTKVSELENDENYLKEHQDLSEYAKTAEVEERLDNKADLVRGKVPREQLPETVTSWNDLIERPFEERSNIIKWNIDNIDYADKITIKSTTSSVTLYKVHGGTLSEEDLIGGTITIDGIEKQLGGSEIPVIPRTNFIINNPSSPALMKYIVVLKDCNLSFPNPTLTATYATTGIYFAEGVTEIRPSKSYIKQIDPKFIPELDYVKTEEVEEQLSNKADLVNGKVPSEQLPEFEIPEMDYIPNSEKGVPNGVSTLDENGKVPSEQLPDNIGGGLSEVAWNDIKDPPFGETKAFDDIIWDGSLNGKTYVEVSVGEMNGVLYKVSDEVLTRDQIEGASLCADGMLMGSSGDVIEPASVYAETETGSLILNGALAYSITTSNEVVSADAIGAQFTFPEPGIWFVGLDAGGFIIGVKSLIAANKTKQLDSKFIPDLGHVSESKIGSANGIASLDENTKIPIEQIPVDEITPMIPEWRKINEFTIGNGGGQGTGYDVSWDGDAHYIDTVLINGDSDGNSLNLKAAAIYITDNDQNGVGANAYFSVNNVDLPKGVLACTQDGSYTYSSYTVKKECNRYKIEHMFQKSESSHMMSNPAISTTKLECKPFGAETPNINQLSIEFVPHGEQTDMYFFDLHVEVWGIDA